MGNLRLIRGLEIKVLGTGCASCKALFATVQQAVTELGIEANVVKEEDILKIVQYGVMSLPALVIDEVVIAKGKLSAAEVKDILLTQKTK